MRTRHLLLFLLLAIPLGACSRQFPSTLPSRSAASAEASAAPAAVVGLALREDPPLPGEPADGWSGLDGGTDTGAHAHHGGGHVAR